MDQTNSFLRYSDAEDKCFGVVGMTIGLLIFDAEEHLVSISIDREDMDALELDAEFGMMPVQAASAKAIWQSLYKRFQLNAALMMSNVMCRCYVRRRVDISPDMRAEMLDRLADEAEYLCQLERDETEMIYRKNLSYLQRAFASRQVAAVVSRMASDLGRAHTMPRERVLEYLASLT